MKVTFVLPCPDLSGGIRVISTYAQYLHERGHQVTLVSVPVPQPSLKQQIKSILKGKGLVKQDGCPRSHVDTLEVAHHKLNRYRPVVDKDVPDGDIVIATWWETAEWVWNLAASKGKKVHFMQDYETWAGQVERVDAVCRLPIPKIVIANWVKTLLQERFHQTPVALIPNSVDLDKFFAPQRGKQPIPTVGVIYTTMLNKGCDISLKAFHLAKQQIPNLRLVAFGTSEVQSELPLPEGTDYHFKVPDHQLKNLYSQCDAWLFGTRIEGFGLPIVEAMACRTPVIGTPAGAAPELLANGAGILVNPEDPEDMAQAIVQICKMSEPEWQTMSNRAYKRVTNHTWEDATNQFEAVLKAMVTQQQSKDYVTIDR